MLNHASEGVPDVSVVNEDDMIMHWPKNIDLIFTMNSPTKPLKILTEFNISYQNWSKTYEGFTGQLIK